MTLALDPAAEQLIQRELARGHYREPADVIAHALNLLEAEREWLEVSKPALNARLAESIAQIDRGEGIAGEHILEVLAARRQTRR